MNTITHGSYCQYSGTVVISYQICILVLESIIVELSRVWGRVKALYGLVGLIDVLYGCRDSSNVLYPLLLGMTWYDVLNLLNA